MEFSPSGRFQLVDTPPLPGKCAICGYSASGENEPDDRRRYVDFGLDIDYYGVVVFCTECVHSLVTQLGYALPSEVDEMRTHLGEALGELSRLSVAVEGISGLANYLVECGWITLGTNSDESPGESKPEETIIDEGRDDSETDESVDEPRSDDLLSTSDGFGL